MHCAPCKQPRSGNLCQISYLDADVPVWHSWLKELSAITIVWRVVCSIAANVGRLTTPVPSLQKTTTTNSCMESQASEWNAVISYFLGRHVAPQTADNTGYVTKAQWIIIIKAFKLHAVYIFTFETWLNYHICSINFCTVYDITEDEVCLLQKNYTVSQKRAQLWNGIARNYMDRFWWYLAEIFKSL